MPDVAASPRATAGSPPTGPRPLPRTPRAAVVALLCAAGLAVAPLPAAALPAALPAAAQPGTDCVQPSRAVAREVPPAQQLLAFERAWDLSRGRGIAVAVVDTGVDAAVPQLAGRVAAGPSLVPGSGPSDTDCAGHGTFLAGLVAAGRLPEWGFAGVAPEAEVIPVRYRDGRERGFTASAGAALRAAMDAGARVVLFGAPLPLGDAALVEAVADAERQDVLVVTPGFTLPTGAVAPATLPDVLLSATELERTASSGPSTSGPHELAAPTAGVTSISRSSGGAVQGSGPEMAAAYTAGTAALVWSYRPRLTAAQVKQRLVETALPPTESTSPRVLDPLGAVADVLTAAEGGQPDREAVAGPRPPADDGTTTRALLFTGVGLVLVLAGGVGAATLRARRRRA